MALKKPYIHEQIDNISNEIGSLLNLNTDDRTNLVTAVNENVSKLTITDKKTLQRNLFLNQGYKGLCIRTWVANSLYTDHFKVYAVNKAKDLKVDTIELIINTYQQTVGSTNVEYRVPISQQEIKDYIKHLKDNGFGVFLKIHVESDDGAWRATFTPSSTDSWFTSYKTMILKYATLAEESGCEMFSVGSEYRSLTTSTYTTKWSDIIDSVRAAYSGLLTYGANCNATEGDEYQQIEFWDKLDFIGLDNYLYPTTNTSRSVEDMKLLFFYNTNNKNLIQVIDEVYAKYKKPVLMTEWGVDKTNYTEQYQANYFEAFINMYGAKDYVKGMFQWVIDPEGYGAGWLDDNTLGYNVVKKYNSMIAKPSEGKIKDNSKIPAYITSETTSDNASSKWTKIASIKLLKYSSITANIEVIGEQINTLTPPVGNILFRVYNDGDSYPPKCILNLNGESTFDYDDFKYIITENTATSKTVELYVKISGSNNKHTIRLISTGNNSSVSLFSRQPLLNDTDLPSGTSGYANKSFVTSLGYPKFPNGMKIYYGLLNGSFVNGRMNTTVNLPAPITTLAFLSGACNWIPDGFIEDVKVSVQAVNGSPITQLIVRAKHDTITSTQSYYIRWICMGY